MSRLEALKRNVWIFYLVCAAFIAAWVVLVARAPSCDLFGHGFLLLYSLVNLSPYYYLCIALLPSLFSMSSPPLRRYAMFGTLILVAAHAIFFPGMYTMLHYFPHLVSALAIASFFLGLAAFSLVAYASRLHPSRT